MKSIWYNNFRFVTREGIGSLKTYATLGTIRGRGPLGRGREAAVFREPIPSLEEQNDYN
jgi:hypothetical protein